MLGVVETVTPLHAEPVVIGRAVAPFHEQDAVVLDVVRQLAAHAAIRADRIHLAVGHGQRHVARRHQRAGRAGLHALAAGHAGAGAHRVGHIEDDAGMIAAKCQPDHVIGLFVAAGAHAARALDAGIEVDRDGGVRQIGRHRLARGKAWLADFEPGRPLIKFTMARVRGLRHVGLQQFQHHALRAPGALGVRVHRHAIGRRAAAGRRQHAFPVDLDHAGAAVAGGIQPILVAKMRNLDAFPARHLQQRLPGAGGHLPAIEPEGDLGVGRRLDERDFSAGQCIHGWPS
ncbi:hypothetical protein D3C86_1283350 [compost metagenome]